MADGYKNFAVGTVQVAPDPADTGTTLSLRAGEGSQLPAVPFNAVVKPIARLLSLPFIVVTLGLFLVVVNAFMLQVLEWICEWLDLPFTIDQFWWDAIWAAIIISIVSWALSLVLPDDD